MQSTQQELRHPLVALTFPVVALLFRNTAVVHTPHTSTGWSLEPPVVVIHMSYTAVSHRKKNISDYPSLRTEQQFGQPPGGEDELPGFVSGFCKEIFVNSDRFSRRLCTKDSSAVSGYLS